MFNIYFLICLLFFSSCSLINNWRENKVVSSKEVKLNLQESVENKKELDLFKQCQTNLGSLPGKHNIDLLNRVCSQVSLRNKCFSSQGVPIFHYEKAGVNPHKARILAIGAIHGDEESSASIIRDWMERLEKISPRSTWRLVPILNPDGRKLNTRMNYNRVDLNRNFPTQNWKVESKWYWEKRVKQNPRRYPGPSAGSELETQCAINHINDFKPDLIISIHTPLGVLDFDGPKLNFPKYKLIPWRSLGHYPGSLGRYMWRDHKVPVLTIELKGNETIKSLKEIDKLQDIAGLVALMVKQKHTH